MTVNEYLVERLGVADALRLEVWLVWWAMFVHAEGREPSAEDFVESFGLSVRTAERRLAAWREAFPLHRTPTLLLAEWQRHARGRLTPKWLGGWSLPRTAIAP